MEPAEILAQIKPCDMDNPYIFVSYSAQDNRQVWADVLAFQQLGYNVWLDERNLDKTKESWTEDALSAISDLDCLLVVFYVSSASLTSEACYRELNQTTETLTVRIHFGPVRFIAVDVEDVGDIGVFTQSVYNHLMERKDISKKEKTAKAIVLSQFCDNFFDSNNERVRVHPKGEPNRKIGYYEEIVASFPDAAKIYPPVKTLAELSPTPVHASPAPAPESKAGGSLADQVARMLGRIADPISEVPASTQAHYPGPAAGAEAAPDSAAGAPDAAKVPSSGLVDQVSSLLDRGGAKREGKPAGDADPSGGKKPSLAEQIQRKLEEQRRGDKGDKK